jgi:hypothetical protein
MSSLATSFGAMSPLATSFGRDMSPLATSFGTMSPLATSYGQREPSTFGQRDIFEPSVSLSLEEKTFEPPTSPVLRSMNRKRVGEVWQQQMFTPSTSPEHSPEKQKVREGLEEFVESLISPPTSP